MEHIAAAAAFSFLVFWLGGGKGMAACRSVIFQVYFPEPGFLESTLETEASAEGSLELSISWGARGYTPILLRI